MAKSKNWFYWLGKTLMRISFACLFRARSYDIHNLPATGGVLVLANHQSYLDPPFVGIPALRQLRYLGRDTLFRNPVFAAILHAVGLFPIRRGKSDKDAIRTVIDELRQGHPLVMFPEGTRSTGGKMLPFKSGFLLLVRRARVPVMPVGIHGTHRALPRGAFLPRPVRISLIYGKPIPPEVFDKMNDEQAADIIKNEIAKLIDKLKRLS